MNADACLGSSVMGYQAREIAYGLCEAGFLCLVRLSSPVAEGHDSPINAPAQRGEAGFGPSCVMATNVTNPAPN